MQRELFHWHSQRLGREMAGIVYGHWGPPLVCFPTSGGDEWEQENQGMIRALEDFIDAGRVKVFCINTADSQGLYNKQAHPFHRSYMQAQYDDYVRNEVVPFIFDNCKTVDVPISTMGASFGAYHAANTLLKHPDVIKRCFAMSGVYDVRQFMDGMYDDNFYFNNPMDYMGNLSDQHLITLLSSCDIHLATGTGPWENSGPTYQFSQVLSAHGIRHSLDDWGPLGGHDWPYWKHQMGEYLGRLF
jgi:esterase/lipase superfamily enzyme